MTLRVRKWGNSLALRIPKTIAELSSIKQDSEVEIRIVDNKIVIEPTHKKKTVLKDLLARITPDNLHDEIDTGSPRGRETW